MHKSSALDALMPYLRQQLLAATVLQPDRSWYLTELSQFLAVTPSSLQRELNRLTEAEILNRRQDGNRVYYQANQQCPFLSDIQSLMIKTIGLIELIAQALESLTAGIDVAFVFGSFAQSAEIATSDVDLMIIGNVGLSELAPLLRNLERRINRPINPIILTAKEAKEKLAGENHFIERVRVASKLYLWGKNSELGKAFDGQTPKDPHGNPS